MEATRLIEETRCALARCTAAPEIVAEVRQVQALVEAVGSHLAMAGPPAVRTEAMLLSEAGMLGCRSLSYGGRPVEGLRAARLTRIDDPLAALSGLEALLGDTVAALVGVSASAAGDGPYWQCMRAIDAADESADRVSGMLRGLALPERGPAV